MPSPSSRHHTRPTQRATLADLATVASKGRSTTRTHVEDKGAARPVVTDHLFPLTWDRKDDGLRAERAKYGEPMRLGPGHDVSHSACPAGVAVLLLASL
jgi:hypothetical protein